MSEPTIQDFARFVNQTWGSSNMDYDKQLSIASLGKAGEAGEVVEHVKKYLRDGKDLVPPLDVGEYPDIIYELGDDLYYNFKITELLGFTVQDVMKALEKKLNIRRESKGKAPVYLVDPRQPPVDNRFVADGCEKFDTPPAEPTTAPKRHTEDNIQNVRTYALRRFHEIEKQHPEEFEAYVVLPQNLAVALYPTICAELKALDATFVLLEQLGYDLDI